MVDLTGPLPDLPDGGVMGPDAGIPERPIGLPVVWSSIAYEVLDSSAKPTVRSATDSIDQAFEQSPYLRRN